VVREHQGIAHRPSVILRQVQVIERKDLLMRREFGHGLPSSTVGTSVQP